MEVAGGKAGTRNGVHTAEGNEKIRRGPCYGDTEMEKKT